MRPLIILIVSQDGRLKSYSFCKFDKCEQTHLWVVEPTMLPFNNILSWYERAHGIENNDYELLCIDGYGIDGVRSLPINQLLQRVGFSQLLIEGVHWLYLLTSSKVVLLEKREIFRTTITNIIRHINRNLEIIGYCGLMNTDGDKYSDWGEVYGPKYEKFLFDIFNTASSKIKTIAYPWLTLQKILPENNRVEGIKMYGIEEISSEEEIISEIRACLIQQGVAQQPECKYVVNNYLIKEALG